MTVAAIKHLDRPKPDTGHFSTREVRSRDEPSTSTSRIVAFPPNQYRAPPNLAAGFSSLDISCEGPVRANIVANEISNASFKITVETWGASRLYEASAVWIEHKANAKDCVFGQFDLRDAQTSSKKGPANHDDNNRNNNSVTGSKNPPSSTTPARAPANKKHAAPCFFPKPFREPPEIICWLNHINMASGGGGGERDYKLRAFADEINPQSFMAHLNSWGNGADVRGAAMCWIAFPKDKRHVDSGRIHTLDVRRRADPRRTTSARVHFRPGRFRRPPTVLAAINMLDAAGDADLRVRLTVSEVDAEGFRWTFETWDDSTLYAAAAHWIALGFS